MNILYNILAALFCLVVGYIFGAIPTSIWIGKVFFHQDPRNFGSHNAGGTNAGRIWGKKVGFIIILLDMIKCIAPLWICWAIFTFAKFDISGTSQSLCPSINEVDNFGLNSTYIIPWSVYWLAPLGCSIGHCWPIFAGFKGGKSAAVFIGTAAGSSWLLGFLPGLSFFLFLKAKKYVSLASMLTSIVVTLCNWVWTILIMTKAVDISLISLPMYGMTIVPSFVSSIVFTLITVIVIIRHRENISRIKNGTERKITWMK